MIKIEHAYSWGGGVEDTLNLINNKKYKLLYLFQETYEKRIEKNTYKYIIIYEVPDEV